VIPGDITPTNKEVLNLLKGHSCEDCCMGCSGMPWAMICPMWESVESYKKRMDVLMKSGGHA
jgi:hypothetical protein